MRLEAKDMHHWCTVALFLTLGFTCLTWVMVVLLFPIWLIHQMLSSWG